MWNRINWKERLSLKAKILAVVVFPYIALVAYVSLARFVLWLIGKIGLSSFIGIGAVIAAIGVLVVFVFSIFLVVSFIFRRSIRSSLLFTVIAISLNVLVWLSCLLVIDALKSPLIQVGSVYDDQVGRLYAREYVYAEKKESYAKGDKVLVAVYGDKENPCVFDVREISALPYETVQLRSGKDIEEGLWHRDDQARSAPDGSIVLSSADLGEKQYFAALPDDTNIGTSAIVDDVSIAGLVRFFPSRSWRERLSYVVYTITHPRLLWSEKPESVCSSASGTAKAIHTENAFKESRYNELIALNKKTRKEFFSSINTKDWKDYSNNALGVAFSYPIEWGDVITSPEYITDIKRLSEDSDSAVSIHFSLNEKIRLNILSNTKPSSDPQGHSYFRESSDVCEYVSYEVAGRYKTPVEKVCYSNFREMLLESQDRNDGAFKQSYRVNLFGYRKLMNGSADHMIVEESLFDASMPETDHFFEGLSEFSEKYGQRKYAFERDVFGLFVNSVRSIETGSEKPKVVMPDGWKDDESLRAIAGYYKALNDADLEKAYELRGNDESYEVFRKRYENVYKALPRDFLRLEDGSYEFSVDYQDHNEAPVVYHVVMKTGNGKVFTVSSEKISEEVSVGRKLRVAIKQRGNTNYVLLYKNGREIVADQSKKSGEEEWTAIQYKNLRFDGNRFLTYDMWGWEWFGKGVYDIQEEKIVLSLSSPNTAEFSSDKKFYYACALSHFGGEQYVDVYSVPTFKKIYSFFEKNPQNKEVFYDDLTCEYDTKRNVLNFSTSRMIDMRTPEQGSINESWEYNFSDRNDRRVK